MTFLRRKFPGSGRLLDREDGAGAMKKKKSK